MTPLIPPIVVALACREKRGIPVAEQAAILGIGERGLWLRLARRTTNNGCCAWWDEWQVGESVKWCKACGYDFWNLTGNILSDVDWKTSRLHRRALEMTLRDADLKRDPKTKLKITEERIKAWARTLNKLRRK